MSIRRHAAVLGLSAFALTGLTAQTEATAQAPKPSPSASPPSPSAPAPPPSGAPRQFCQGVADCKTFCSSVCTLDVVGWREGTMNTTCRFPADAIRRAGGPQPSELFRIPPLPHVKAPGNAQATQYVIEALKRLNDRIASKPQGWPAGHVAYVRNCYRPPVEEATLECDFIMKAIHLEKKWAGRTPVSAAERKERDSNLKLARLISNPADNLGLTWPGPSPHSRGQACDIVVAKRGDGNRDDATTTCKGVANDTTMKAHSRALDEALTNPTVGAVRLNYEAWHYEFGRYETTGKNCRCVAPACNDKFWPPNCKDGC